MFTEQEKMEMIVEGIQNGDVFMRDGIAVDEYGDPIFEEDTKLKCLEDFFFFLRFLFINLGYVEFDMSHYNHVTFQSFSLIEQSTSETISTSGH